MFDCVCVWGGPQPHIAQGRTAATCAWRAPEPAALGAGACEGQFPPREATGTTAAAVLSLGDSRRVRGDTPAHNGNEPAGRSSAPETRAERLRRCPAGSPSSRLENRLFWRKLLDREHSQGRKGSEDSGYGPGCCGFLCNSSARPGEAGDSCSGRGFPEAQTAREEAGDRAEKAKRPPSSSGLFFFLFLFLADRIIKSA